MIRNEKVRRLTRMGMLAALSVVLVAIIHFPIFPAAAYLEYDPADIPILIGTFLYGPWCGVLLTLVASVIQGLTVSASSGIYGIIMHVIATGVFCLTAGYIYKAKKTLKGALIALICGTIAMAAVMAGANLIITPLFTGMPREAIKALLLPVIVPFNLIKAGINSAVTFLIYKPISRLFSKNDELAQNK